MLYCTPYTMLWCTQWTMLWCTPWTMLCCTPWTMFIVVFHPVNNVVLHPVNNVVLHPVNNVVNKIVQPWKQCIVQPSMLLQLVSTGRYVYLYRTAPMKSTFNVIASPSLNKDYYYIYSYHKARWVLANCCYLRTCRYWTPRGYTPRDGSRYRR